jgi:hypothetical protein
LLGGKEGINVVLFIRCFICLLIHLLVGLFICSSVASMQRCDERLPECTSHGCMVSSLAQRLLRMRRAPGFGCSSRIAIGKEAASDEDRRGLQNFKQTGKDGLKGSRIIKKAFCYT